MYLKSLELSGFKSFAKKTELDFTSRITAIVGPNGSGKSNIAEAFRFVLGEQRMTQMRSKRTEDLIWNGSPAIPRSRHASVTLTFDNRSQNDNARKRLFDIDFDEASLKRVIHRDASTEYHLNDSVVRLKDIMELLGSAHIGSSGHHIISQGETDRILLVNARERKAMVEDALGLKMYQYKKQESERKLERTEQHKKEVESLRREIAPHLKFLKTQVEKVEKTREMRDELRSLYQVYIGAEKRRLGILEETHDARRKKLEGERDGVREKLNSAKDTLTRLERADKKTKELLSLEDELAEVRANKESLAREVGRLEGEVRAREAAHQAQAQAVPVQKVVGFRNELEEKLKRVDESTDLSYIKTIIKEVREMVALFVRSVGGTERDNEREYDLILKQKEERDQTLQHVTAQEATLMDTYERLKEHIEKDQHSGREAERAVFALSAQEQELQTQLTNLERDENERRRDTEELHKEHDEALVLIGSVPTREESVFDSDEERHAMQKQMERLKIRLEDAGTGTGEEILREYEEVRQRDIFLERELSDLETSVEKLKALISDLDERLNVLFGEGITAINTKFQELFSVMFGGGNASLEIVREEHADDDEDGQTKDDSPDTEGVEMRVQLPRKKIRGLHMLSGGERALTSIALLFAVSQVNPPPFILLDETDAALDEANSRRYGDMIERLARDSQLILITHNRETMSRAGILYGVTMGRDGVSQLLSVSLEEAARVAK